MTKTSGTSSKKRPLDLKDKVEAELAKENLPADIEEEEPNSGFSTWLRSGDGIEYMKTFVLINSIIVFVTMTVPHLQKMFDVLQSYWDEYNE